MKDGVGINNNGVTITVQYDGKHKKPVIMVKESKESEPVTVACFRSEETTETFINAVNTMFDGKLII